MTSTPHVPETYPCANCGGDSSSTFDGVPVCGRCEAVAIASLERVEEEISALRKMAREHIRVQLLETRLPLKRSPRDQEPVLPALPRP